MHNRLLPLIATAVLMTGCAVPAFQKSATPEPHAFIDYNPPPAGSDKLRLAVKDLIDVRGQVTTAGSKYFQTTGQPAKRDAKCLSIARRRGVHFVGKTNLSEFAIGVSGSNDYFGTPENPLGQKKNRVRVPGGSSSGSAVAVARGLADVALGTDTAGSIRVPAAACGIAGLKTTHGLVPIDGVYPISPDHLDTVGPMAKDVAGLVTGMDLLVDGFRADYERAKRINPSAASIRVGRLYVPGTSPEVDRAIDATLHRAGFKLYRLNDEFLAKWKKAQTDGNTIASSGAWLTNQHLRGEDDVSLRAKAVMLLGELAHATLYDGAVERKEEWQRTLRNAFRYVDVIALPVLRDAPPRIPLLEEPPLFEAHVLSLQNTVAVNYAGNPALALPVPLIDREPDFPVTSIQLVGPPESEAALLNTGRFIESARPPLRP